MTQLARHGTEDARGKPLGQGPHKVVRKSWKALRSQAQRFCQAGDSRLQKAGVKFAALHNAITREPHLFSGVKALTQQKMKEGDVLRANCTSVYNAPKAPSLTGLEQNEIWGTVSNS